MHYEIADVQKMAPAVFGTEGYAKKINVEKYLFIPTNEAVEALVSFGFEVKSAVQAGTRMPEKRTYVKHAVTFRPPEVTEFSEIIPEILLQNAHDGTSSYVLYVGLYNHKTHSAMVVGNNTLAAKRIYHKGNRTVDEIVGASKNVVFDFKREVLPIVQQMQTKLLTEQEEEEFAKLAIALRWQREDYIPIDEVLKPASWELDNSDKSLWAVYSRLQRHITEGGILTVKGRKIARIRNFSRGIRMNREFWDLAVEFV